MLTKRTDNPIANTYTDTIATYDGAVTVDVASNVMDTIWVTHGDGRPHPLTEAEALSLIEMLRAGRRMLRERGETQ